LPTIKDVAKLAGVAASTASRALSGQGYAGPETRQRVIDAANTLGYSANPAAQLLRAGKNTGPSKMIALFVPSIQNQIIPSVAQGVEDIARRHGYTTVLCNIGENVKQEKDYIEKMLAQSIDGFIVASLITGSDAVHELNKNGVPVVLVNRIKDDSVDAVLIDNRNAAFSAVEYLVSVGHRRIAFAMGDSSLMLYRDRFDGYRDALKRNGLPYREELVMRETYGEESFHALTRNLLSIEEKPDAILASSDPKAVVIMHAAQDMGFRIPKDISIMGIDNIPIGAMLYPALSTVSQPLHELGALAARKLISQIRHKEEHGNLIPPIVDVLETELIIRGTTR
jgi:LacI family transcriptional regulator